MSGLRGLVALVGLWLLAVALCGCISLTPVRDGPVTITRSLNVGLYHSCLSYGVGVMLCEHVRFDPGACAIVIISPKPPSVGLRAALEKLVQPTQALCLRSNEGTSPRDQALSTAHDR